MLIYCFRISIDEIGFSTVYRQAPMYLALNQMLQRQRPPPAPGKAHEFQVSTFREAQSRREFDHGLTQQSTQETRESLSL